MNAKSLETAADFVKRVYRLTKKLFSHIVWIAVSNIKKAPQIFVDFRTTQLFTLTAIMFQCIKIQQLQKVCRAEAWTFVGRETSSSLRKSLIIPIRSSDHKPLVD